MVNGSGERIGTWKIDGTTLTACYNASGCVTCIQN
jgi:hypothetical protein